MVAGNNSQWNSSSSELLPFAFGINSQKVWDWFRWELFWELLPFAFGNKSYRDISIRLRRAISECKRQQLIQWANVLRVISGHRYSGTLEKKEKNVGRYIHDSNAWGLQNLWAWHSLDAETANEREKKNGSRSDIKCSGRWSLPASATHIKLTVFDLDNCTCPMIRTNQSIICAVFRLNFNFWHWFHFVSISPSSVHPAILHLYMSVAWDSWHTISI